MRPLCGAYCDEAPVDRKAESMSRSAVLRSISMVSCRILAPAEVCRKPVMPLSSAAVA